MVLGLVIEQDFIVDPSLYRRSLDAVGLVAEARFVASSLGRIIGYRPLGSVSNNCSNPTDPTLSIGPASLVARRF